MPKIPPKSFKEPN